MARDRRFEFVSEIDAPAREVYDWHARPGALERLTPPWESLTVLDRRGGIEDGGRVVLRVRLLGPWTAQWVARHEGQVPGFQFCDRQVLGPFSHWLHTHRMEPLEGDRCRLRDVVDYRLPSTALGDRLAGAAVHRRLERLFRYRHRITREDLALGSQYGHPRMQRILVSGSSGLVGGELVGLLKTQGHLVSRLVRDRGRSAELQVPWDPAAGVLDGERLEGFDAVIHLAGENISGRRWSRDQKRRILESRVRGTRLLAETLAARARPPRVFLCASAVGYYADRGDAILTEESPSGEGFLSGVCQAWEAACEPLRQAGVRVVNLRLGVVLSPKGGALGKMLPAFKLGIAGRLGSGRQWMSWITIDDTLAAIYHCLLTDGLVGPVNLSAPVPATNADFTRTLARLLRRPAVLPAPAWGLRLALGEMADALLLSSMRMEPRELTRTGFRFRHPGLEDALAHLLGR